MLYVLHQRNNKDCFYIGDNLFKIKISIEIKSRTKFHQQQIILYFLTKYVPCKKDFLILYILIINNELYN